MAGVPEKPGDRSSNGLCALSGPGPPFEQSVIVTAQ